MHSTDLSDDNCFCFALRQASRHISNLYERHLAEAGITPTQFTILSTLFSCSNLTMAELAKVMVMDRTTLVRVLKPMLTRGLVASFADDDDARRLRVELTGAGRTKHDEAVAHWAAAQACFEHRFGQQQAALLRSELFRTTSDVFEE
jgi:DNA-binding MarR family transcriptional regulator